MTSFVDCFHCNHSLLYIDGRLRCNGELCKEICDDFEYGMGRIHVPEAKEKPTIKKKEVTVKPAPKATKSKTGKKSTPKGQGSLF